MKTLLSGALFDRRKAIALVKRKIWRFFLAVALAGDY